MIKHYYALIMAGGGGTRLWPMSRRNRPKQLLPLVDDRTMFRTSVERLSPLFSPEHIYIVTGANYVEALQADVPEIPAENFIVEPYGKNTGPAAGLGVSVIYKRDPEATVAILTADHHIAKERDFRNLLQSAYQLAQDNYIVTLGITPTSPSTGFGYIRQGDQIKKIDYYTGFESLEFTEKPDAATAVEFLASGQYSWNSGMFIWTAKHALAEFERQQGQVHELCQQLIQAVDTSDYDQTLETIWKKMPSISIDFAIMEGAQQMAVIPADIGWSDVGSWEALFDVHQLDESGNYFKGQSARVILDTKNTMVYSNRLVATIGIEDIIVIEADDALLICHKERSQDVKNIVNHLRSTNNEDYL
jgi:mannose-1-phosphate guanylyltransferase